MPARRCPASRSMNPARSTASRFGRCGDACRPYPIPTSRACRRTPGPTPRHWSQISSASGTTHFGQHDPHVLVGRIETHAVPRSSRSCSCASVRWRPQQPDDIRLPLFHQPLEMQFSASLSRRSGGNALRLLQLDREPNKLFFRRELKTVLDDQSATVRRQGLHSDGYRTVVHGPLVSVQLRIETPDRLPVLVNVEQQLHFDPTGLEVARSPIAPDA